MAKRKIMSKNLKHDFRVNIVLIIISMISFTLLGICVYIDNENNYLVGSEFSNNQYKHNKYRIAYKDIYKNKSGTVIPVSKYSQYKKVSKYYGFDDDSSLNKEDFKDSNYLYVVMTTSGCFDYSKYEFYTINDNIVDIYFSDDNCNCPLSRVDTYVYELMFLENITEDMIFNVHFISTDSSNYEMCVLSK